MLPMLVKSIENVISINKKQEYTFTLRQFQSAQHPKVSLSATDDNKNR